MLVAALITCAAATLQAQSRIISMNIAPQQTGNAAIDGEEVFGVPALGTVVGNWNNEGWFKTELKWSDGTMSTVGMDVQFRNERLFFGAAYLNTPLNYCVPHYAATPTDPGTGLDFYNLNENFPDGYFVIAYVNGFVANNIPEAYVTNGRTRFYWSPNADNKTPLTPEGLIETTVTSDPGTGNFPTAHYAVFGSRELPLTSPVLSIRIGHVSGGGIGLGGVQIVSVSDEPIVETGWAGYDIDEAGLVYTGAGFLGWLWVGNDANWVYSNSLSQWAYIETSWVTAGTGAWMHVTDESALGLGDVTQGWAASSALDTWVFVDDQTIGSEGAWVYVVDLSVAE